MEGERMAKYIELSAQTEINLSELFGFRQVTPPALQPEEQEMQDEYKEESDCSTI